MPDLGEPTLGEVVRRLERIEQKLDRASWVDVNVYRADLTTQAERDRSQNARLVDLEEQDRWLMRAMVASFLGLLVEAAAIGILVLQ